MGKEKNIKVFETWLPLFSGFYNTIFEPDLDSELCEIKANGLVLGKCRRMIIDEDTLWNLAWEVFDDNEYEEEVGYELCSAIKESSDMLENVEYQKVASPKEYNYVNDSIDCKISVDIDMLLEWIYKNKEYLDKYFHENYSCYDGFISSYPNSFDGWEMETEKFTILDGHYLGSILEAYFRKKGFSEETLYYESEHDARVSHSAIAELVEQRNIEHSIRIEDENQLEFNFTGGENVE